MLSEIKERENDEGKKIIGKIFFHRKVSLCICTFMLLWSMFFFGLGIFNKNIIQCVFHGAFFGIFIVNFHRAWKNMFKDLDVIYPVWSRFNERN